jgi:hypothetical protein
MLSIDFIVCFACVVLWVGVDTWVLVVYRMAGFMSKIDKSKGEDLVFTVPTITAACAANPACASATAAGIVYVGSKIAEPVAEAVSAVGDAIADGVVIAVDAVQDALNITFFIFISSSFLASALYRSFFPYLS